MKKLNLKFIITGLIGVLLMTSPTFLLAQGGATGQLVVTGNGSKTQGNLVSVNGENALSGRTVISPAKIVTSPDASAKIILTKLGATILFAPNSAMNLSFDGASISGTVTSGTVMVQNIGPTKINITNAGGTVIFSNQPSSVQITTTGVCVMDGETTYNNTVIAAGVKSCDTTTLPIAKAAPAASAGASGSPNYLLFGLIGAAVAAVVIGVVVATGGDDDQTPVSPTR